MDPTTRRALTHALDALSLTFDYLHAYERAGAIRFRSDEVRESPLTQLVRTALTEVQTALAEGLLNEEKAGIHVVD